MRPIARTSVALALILGVAANCGSDRDFRSGSAPGAWAEQAVERVAAMEVAYDNEDPYAAALFYTGGGTLDLTIWDQGIATTPQAVVEAAAAASGALRTTMRTS